jgi:hypothetical protein
MITAGQDILASDFITASAGAGDAGKGVCTNSLGKIGKSFLYDGISDDINAAETITAFRPVFLDDTSDTWKYCDANDTARLNFNGFALVAGSAGNPLLVQCSNIVRGFSSLDAGKKYYIQDDGTIGLNSGTYAILVGVALTTTELLIMKYPLIKLSGYDFTVRGLTTSNLNDTKTIDAGFKPRYFEATVWLNESEGQAWSSSSAAWIIAGGFRIKGTVGGIINYFGTTVYHAVGPNSQNVNMNPFYELNVGNPSYGAVNFGSPITINNYGGQSISVTVSVSGNSLIFTFTSNQGGGNSDVAYGIADIIIQE